ncbi:hypothetical protein T484DRAFT_2822345 [Baffinella frigidus]|nr:hypothetical protein T484DRAFT_2822345 [Cryptophyta sp. CCMP2293]
MEVAAKDLTYRVDAGCKTAATSPFVPGESIASITRAQGVVITSRYLLENAASASATFRDGLVAGVDATFKLSDENWVVIPYGFNGLRADRGVLKRSFRPWGFGFAKSESGASVSRTLSSVKQAVESRLLQGSAFDVKVRY